MSASAYSTIADALVAQAKADLANARLDAARRPIGERRIDIDFWDRREGNKPIDEIRWCAVLVKWTGDRWQRVRRLGGPCHFEDALDRCSAECRRRGLERVL